jgi:hypothetical protein
VNPAFWWGVLVGPLVWAGGWGLLCLFGPWFDGSFKADKEQGP